MPLVLPATTKAADLAHTTSRFLALGAAKLIFTRLDETASLGAVVNETLRSGDCLCLSSAQASRSPQTSRRPRRDGFWRTFCPLAPPAPRWQPDTETVAEMHGAVAMTYAYQMSEETRAAEREQLILDHLPQVRLIARKIHGRLPESVSLEDLISTGVVGLIAAIDNFDPGHNVKLKTYAEYKIRGAILDSLRGLDWAPRQQRKRAKLIEAAISAAEQKLHRMPGESEIAAQLNLSVEEYHEWLVEIRGLNLGSLESSSPSEDGQSLLKYVSDSEEHWPSRILERSELEQLLAQAIEKMPQIEKTILSLYYHEEMTLREISKIVKLHESRVSQLKSQAILRLRSYIEKRWPCRRGH